MASISLNGNGKKIKGWLQKARESYIVNALYTFLIPLITTVTLEWIARGNLQGNKQNNGFFQAISRHPASFILSFLLLLFIYILISQLSGWHGLATGIVGVLGNVPAVVTYYKLTMRGEPFLPWDIFQVGDLMAVKSNVALTIQPSMIITAVLFVVLIVLGCFIKLPEKKEKKTFKLRMILSASSLVGILGLMFGVFLSPAGTAAVGIREDMWMQDRYYRTNGVVTAFLTNLQMLKIEKPAGYNEGAVQEIAEETTQNLKSAVPVYKDSFAANTTGAIEQTPDIIFVMAESFWDVTELEGISYDQELTANLTALSEEGASGKMYSPSFGGGTCDVEFEVLTGYSMENLPNGSKAFQQYVTGDLFSLPWYLKSEGYSTLAIHGYGRKFWNRDQAYPRIGIDRFIASDEFVDPDKKRGFISDEAMVDRIIEEYEKSKASSDAPVFIHAVTMQNHTTYSRDKYPEEQLVKVLEAPATIPDKTVGQLEDCATGIRDMDAALGRLADYLRATDRPTLLVFWGDHLNPMSDGFCLFEETGFIEKGDTASPRLHQTPLLIWSNYADNRVDLGTISAYNVTPVMMDLYGIEKPLYYDFATQQMGLLQGRTRGITIEPDNTFTEEISEEQQEALNKQAILQYNYMFGTPVLDTYIQKEE